MHRFYVPGLAAEGEITLPEEEAHHLARVLRLQPGEIVVLFDGRGREVLGRIERIDSKRVTVRISEHRQPIPEPPVRILLAQAVLKGDKTEDVVRDAVMLGAWAVQPFLSRRTEISRKAAVARQDRWRRTALSSAKQCGRAVLPGVMDVRPFEEVLAAHSEAMRLLFVEPGAGQAKELNRVPMLGASPSTAVVLFVGPEGGWDPAEIQTAAAAGVTLMTFGQRTLRADAAGAAALAILQFLWERR